PRPRLRRVRGRRSRRTEADPVLRLVRRGRPPGARLAARRRRPAGADRAPRGAPPGEERDDRGARRAAPASTGEGAAIEGRSGIVSDPYQYDPYQGEPDYGDEEVYEAADPIRDAVHEAMEERTIAWAAEASITDAIGTELPEDARESLRAATWSEV